MLIKRCHYSHSRTCNVVTQNVCV